MTREQHASSDQAHCKSTAEETLVTSSDENRVDHNIQLDSLTINLANFTLRLCTLHQNH